MSAAMREPASTAAVVRHYLRLLGSERNAIGFVVVGTLALMGSVATNGFEGIAAMIWLMLFYP
ncbi:MAG TPA: hypothetical protein VF771_17720, partial [Longimicrobiaceae bacterium]